MAISWARLDCVHFGMSHKGHSATLSSARHFVVPDYMPIGLVLHVSGLDWFLGQNIDQFTGHTHSIRIA